MENHFAICDKTFETRRLQYCGSRLRRNILFIRIPYNTWYPWKHRPLHLLAVYKKFWIFTKDKSKKCSNLWDPLTECQLKIISSFKSLCVDVFSSYNNIWLYIKINILSSEFLSDQILEKNFDRKDINRYHESRLFENSTCTMSKGKRNRFKNRSWLVAF